VGIRELIVDDLGRLCKFTSIEIIEEIPVVEEVTGSRNRDFLCSA